jgi:hypothetical protein
MMFCRENCANGDDKPQIIASHHHVGSWLHLMSGTAGASESKKCPASLPSKMLCPDYRHRRDVQYINLFPAQCNAFGRERSKEDQIQLFVGNIMRKAVEIKEHRLKNLRGTGPGDRGRGASRGQVGAGVKPKLLTEWNDRGKQ